MKSKKGFVADNLILLMVMFVFMILFVVGAYIATSLSNTGTGLDGPMKNSLAGLLAWNSIAPIFVIGSGLALILSAVMIRSQPAFFLFFFLIQVVILFVSMQFSNVYQSIMTGNPLSAVANQFDLWIIVFKYFPFISLVLSIIFAVAVFAFVRE